MRGRFRIGDDMVVELAETFRLMSDPTRLKIILACRDAPAAVNEMAEKLGISAPSSRIICGFCVRRDCYKRIGADGRYFMWWVMSISGPCWPIWLTTSVRKKPRTGRLEVVENGLCRFSASPPLCGAGGAIMVRASLHLPGHAPSWSKG